MSHFIFFTKITVFENHRKSLIKLFLIPWKLFGKLEKLFVYPFHTSEGFCTVFENDRKSLIFVPKSQCFKIIERVSFNFSKFLESLPKSKLENILVYPLLRAFAQCLKMTEKSLILFWQKLIKNAKNCQFGNLLKTWSVTRHTVFESKPKCLILNLSILAFSANFCPIKSDLSGNTVWPQASGFLKVAKLDYFGHF